MEVTTSERRASGGAAPELPAQNLVKAFYEQVDRLGDDLAIRDEARDVEMSWNELRDTVHRIAGGLAKLGVGKGDTIAIMLNNRWEFIPCDLAGVSLGAVPFSIYQTSAPEQIQYVLSDAEGKVAIIERPSSTAFKRRGRGFPTLEHVIVVDGEGGDHTLDELMEMDPEFDPAESVERARAGRPADADLHVGHHRSPEGRPAHAPQPALRGRNGGRDDPAAGAGRQGDLVAAGRARRRARTPTTTCR